MASKDSKEDRANDLFKKAEKTYKKMTMFAVSKEKNYDDASELFEQAGHQFKISGDWGMAGKAYERAGKCQLILKAKQQAANKFILAAEAFEHDENLKDSIRLTEQAAELFEEENRGGNAAKHYQALGDTYTKMSDFDNALKMFEKASTLARLDNRSVQSEQCNIKIGMTLAMLERYEEAAEMLEQIAGRQLEDDMLKFSAKDQFLRAGLCHLANADLLGAEHQIDRYCLDDMTFFNQREYKFLRDLTHANKEFDCEEFTRVVHEWERVTRLNPWMSEMIVRIKLKVTGLEVGFA